MAQLLQTLALASAISLTFPLSVYAHMEMRWPYAFRSKYDPAVTDPDYDNTFPLRNDGSNYPCKGYHTLPASEVSAVTYTPGQTYNITLAGTANHMGGSCQLSLSYDNGQTFRVIKSMIGGCPLKLDWDFVVPSDAPSSDNALLAWTWFNLVGNREMYMNCARVTIAGQPVQRYRRYQTKRQNSLNSLPENFACNIANGCTTIERRAVDLPNPGPVVETNSDEVVPDPGPFFTLTATPTGDAFSTAGPTTTPIATIAPYPVSNTTTFTLTSSRLAQNSTNGTAFSSSITSDGATSTASFNSTSLLTVTSSSTTTTTMSTTTATTTPLASPAFFYTVNSTSATTTPTSTMAAPTTFAPYPNGTTTYASFANATSDLAVNSTTTTISNLTTSTTTTASTITSTLMFFQTSATTTTTVFSSSATSTSTGSTTAVSTSTVTLTTSTTTSVSSTFSRTLSLSSTLSTSTSSTLSTSTTSTSSSSTLTTSTSSLSLTPSTLTTLTTLTTSTSTTTTTGVTTLTSSSTTAGPTATIIATTCIPGSFTCNSTTTFSQCVSNGSGSGTYVFMGSVAAGTQCVNGAIVRQNAGTCTPDGSLQCNGENAFYICEEGGLISMGSVAPGTACRNGTIGFA